MSDDLLVEFLAEATDHLGQAEDHLLALLRAGAADADSERVNACFRSLHTIKGNSGFLSLPRINRLAHAGEQVLDALRTQRLSVDATVFDALLGTISRLREQTQHLNESGHEAEGDDGPWIRRLESLLVLAAHVPATPCRPDEHGCAIDNCLAEIIANGATDRGVILAALDQLTAAMEAGGWCPPARAFCLKMRFLAEGLTGQEHDPVYAQILSLCENLQHQHLATVHSAVKPVVASALEPVSSDTMADFTAESNDLLASAEAIVVRGDTPSQDEVNAVFRSFHTIKGMAAYLNQREIEAKAHEFEAQLIPFRDGTAAVSTDFSALVLAGIDVLRRLVAAPLGRVHITPPPRTCEARRGRGRLRPSRAHRGRCPRGRRPWISAGVSKTRSYAPASESETSLPIWACRVK